MYRQQGSVVAEQWPKTEQQKILNRVMGLVYEHNHLKFINIKMI